MIIGIDASNLRAGGGVTHLVELLRVADPSRDSFTKVVVWGGDKTLQRIDDRSWLLKINDPQLNKSLFQRTWWQWFSLKTKAVREGCDILFVPGGSDASGFRPFVTMSRNMLPFEWKELRRYGWSLITLKLLLLRFTQSRTFRKANGLIFLTRYAEKAVTQITGPVNNCTTIIPHGIASRFFIDPGQKRSSSSFTEEHPCRVLYVSIIDVYKHQWHVVKAVDMLRQEGLHVILQLIGPPAGGMDKLQKAISALKSGAGAVEYKGGVDHNELHSFYKQADICVFASSCENMPNILLEGMAAGLPIAASADGPMPEILGNAGLYFNPENPVEIANAVRRLILSDELRNELAQKSFATARIFSWEKCVHETFGFLRTVVDKKKQGS